MGQIAVRLAEDELAALDAAVAAGRYPSRAAAVRAGVREIMRVERSRELADAYRRAYADAPPDDWFAESSAHAAAELLTERQPRP